jgi:hypothetical protein
MRNVFRFLLLMPLACMASPVKDLDESYAFLVSPRDTRGGVLYVPAGGAVKGNALPLSFVDSEQYWGAYVCTLPNVNCTVTDVYNPADYTLQPLNGTSAELQRERVNVHNGANIYDAAVWQIAVVLGSVVNQFTNFVTEDAYRLAANQNRLHTGGGHADSYIAAPAAGAGLETTWSGRRAITRGELFLYNGHSISDPNKAYSYRMTAPRWLADDPLMGSRYASLITAHDLPPANPDYHSGRISWSDWRPVTGENAWAYLLGPLHAAYIHYVLGLGRKSVPFREPAVQNALDVLPTFALMQSPSGAVYYGPSGSLKNDRNEAVNTHLVSVENNFSLYAGLNVLQATLLAELSQERGLTSTDRRTIVGALRVIHTMTDGGAFPDQRPTRGLLRFIREMAWHDGGFVQGGFADDPARGRAWDPSLEPKAVDVNTWGVAVLGAGRIDGWFGFGAAYRVWQNVRSWGAYGVDRTLWGVGYSDQDGNGLNPDGTYRQGILSAEWTAGAIVMLRTLIRHYEAIPGDSRNYAEARQYVKALREDEAAMLEGVQTLRFDRYRGTAFPGKPADYGNLIVQPSKPYLYASKRYQIPFGWYANPLPSTASTGWMIMVADYYDPFAYGGSPGALD